jgi:hypothetical protein
MGAARYEEPRKLRIPLVVMLYRSRIAICFSQLSPWGETFYVKSFIIVCGALSDEVIQTAATGTENSFASCRIFAQCKSDSWWFC